MGSPPPPDLLFARVCEASDFLGDLLQRDPELLRWVAGPEVLMGPRPPSTLRRELSAALRLQRTEDERLDALRVFKRRELLRIGVRDVFRLATVPQTLSSLSELAAVLIEAALRVSERALRTEHPSAPALRPRGFAVIALGKLGGGELNFSSDVDLLYVHASDRGRGSGRPEHYERLARRLTTTLDRSTAEGQVYRVDLRLRPEGRMGSLAHSISNLRRYYAERGQPWERLMLMKACPVAGDRRMGRLFLDTVRRFIYTPHWGPEAVASVWRLHGQVATRTRLRGEEHTNVKLGLGGIREIELAVQTLQARFGGRRTALRQRSTLAALSALRTAGRLTAKDAGALKTAYVFLRDVENKLQMAGDAQVHVIPTDPQTLRGLARTLGYGETGGRDAAQSFLADHARHTAAVHAVFTRSIQQA
jgi:[glutamine synthetase] adenylyltransferase / [glutamine synthetase]-adenylyl-L-tyrosine phosphorylase